MTKQTVHCPDCGRLLILGVASNRKRPQPQSKSTFQHSQSLNQSLPAAIPDNGNWERITPISRLNTDDVTTALYDAAASFGLATIAVGGFIWILGGYIHLDGYKIDLPLVLAPGIGLSIALWRYFGGMALARSLLEIIETATSTDINNDGHIGPPPPQTVKVEVKDSPNKRWQFAHLNIEPVKLHTLARGVLGGSAFTDQTAIKIGLTQNEFRNLREEFLSRGWVVWRHPTRKQQGVQITNTGKMVLRAIASTPLSALPGRESAVLDRKQQYAAGNSAGDYEFVKEGR